ncbi:MAG TPA: carbon-nitrogen hydrolase family protein [Bacillota bacterium]|nr:carbon-nitrogen hydrolase family protein [Bacillota bacterium]
MKYKMALCQIKGSFQKEKSIGKAQAFIKEASEKAEVVALPEMWNCPYGNKYFKEYAEEENGRTVLFMSKAAAQNDIYLIGGTIPEMEEGKIYNTSFCFDTRGNLIAKHRKIHLFDVDIEDGIRFMESETLSAGDSVTVMETEYGGIGIAVCYDVRFPEWSRAAALEGATLLIIPGAFNMTSGPAFWELMMRTRAIDNQVYVAAASPARNLSSSYHAWGHSMIVNPWGGIMAEAGSGEEIIVATSYSYTELTVPEALAPPKTSTVFAGLKTALCSVINKG